MPLLLAEKPYSKASSLPGARVEEEDGAKHHKEVCSFARECRLGGEPYILSSVDGKGDKI